MKTALPEKCPDYYTRCPSISALSGSSKRIESSLSGLHGASAVPNRTGLGMSIFDVN